MPEPLTDVDIAILDFEEMRFKYLGRKESLIREQLGMSSTRYYQRLNWLIDQPEALAYAPMLVRRLQRLRDARKAQRVRSRA